MPVCAVYLQETKLIRETLMRLLLVEDDRMLADGIKQGLATAGYVVDAVGSAEEALDALTSDEFDAAIIDIGLPNMDGMELTQRLRQRGQDMPVLMLTARDALQDRVQGLDAGADDYMVKPFDLPELLARLRALPSPGTDTGAGAGTGTGTAR